MAHTPTAGSEDLRVALLGYGLAGRVFHAPLVEATPGMRVAAVVTADPERSAQAAADLPGAAVLARADLVWAAPEAYDVVVVATANSAHVPQATAALECGLPVVVDKPLAATAEQAQELIDLAARRSLMLTVFQNRRWDSDILTVRRLAGDGVLGRLHRLESRFERWRPTPKGGWREDGPAEDLPGLLYDLGAHLVDQALLLMGPVTAVAASARCVRDGATADDDTQLLLQHADGGVSLLWASAVSAFPQPRLRVLGTAGGVELAELDCQEDQLREGIRPGDAAWGAAPADARDQVRTVGPDGADVLAPAVRERGRWQDFYAGVASCLRTWTPPPVDPRDVVADLRVLEAAVAAARAGEVVHLDPPAGHVTGS